MKNPYVAKGPDDGYSDYMYNAVFDDAWKLAARVPTTRPWANALCWLFDNMVTTSFSRIENPLELAARWRLDLTDADAIEEETKSVRLGWLSSYQRVRKGLARLALKKDPKVLTTLLSSDDLAFRCAAYAEGSLTPEQLSAAQERDGALEFNEIRFRPTAERPRQEWGGTVFLILKYIWRAIAGLITIGFVLFVFSRLQSRQEFIFVSLFGIIYSLQRSIFQTDAYRSSIFAMTLDRELRRVRRILDDPDMPSATDIDKFETSFKRGFWLQCISNSTIGVVFLICLWELLTHL
jgi:hypothetical protein